MSFIVYDLTFLVLFAIFVSVFLYTRKKNLKKEGLLFLYRTSWGIKLINIVGKRNPKTFHVLSWMSIVTGYFLMVGMFYLLGRIMYLYIAFPSIVREIKVPPITPLIPYLPQVFKLDFLPPFYFTYWILIIAIIAITHEFAHGIFAAYNKVKIKSTGFGFFPFFLPVFLAAFVELDEKVMAKRSIFGQLAVLSAGTFANVLTAVLFFFVLIGFFSFAFTPSGIIYDTYPYSIVKVSEVHSFNGFHLHGASYEDILELSREEGLNYIEVNEIRYVATKQLLEEQKENQGSILLYNEAPAVKNNLGRVILEINGNKITSIEEIESELLKYSPGEKVSITTLDEENNPVTDEVVLDEHPEANKAWLGIGFSGNERRGVIGKVYLLLSSFKNPNVYYEQKFSDLSIFVYDLLWWIVLISISVALVNMLPVGIFDGGRFFYLTILALTKNDKIAKKFFMGSTYFILFLVLVLMGFWAISFF